MSVEVVLENSVDVDIGVVEGDEVNPGHQSVVVPLGIDGGFEHEARAEHKGPEPSTVGIAIDVREELVVILFLHMNRLTQLHVRFQIRAVLVLLPRETLEMHKSGVAEGRDPLAQTAFLLRLDLMLAQFGYCKGRGHIDAGFAGLEL